MRHRPGGVGLTARATTQECTQIAESGLSGPFRGICVHCCDASRDTNRVASCVRWHKRLSHHGVPAAPPRWPSRLVGKTGSARVAPLPGWHLRQSVNPHEPLKSQKWDLFKVERTVASTPAYLHEHMEFHRFNPNATGICIFRPLAVSSGWHRGTSGENVAFLALGR